MMKIKSAKNKLTFEGCFIFDNAEEVKETLFEQLNTFKGNTPIVLDLSHVEEIDSSGLQLVVSFFKTLEKRRIPYKVSGISDEMLEILTISGLNKYFNLEV